MLFSSKANSQLRVYILQYMTDTLLAKQFSANVFASCVMWFGTLSQVLLDLRELHPQKWADVSGLQPGANTGSLNISLLHKGLQKLTTNATSCRVSKTHTWNLLPWHLLVFHKHLRHMFCSLEQIAFGTAIFLIIDRHSSLRKSSSIISYVSLQLQKVMQTWFCMKIKIRRQLLSSRRRQLRTSSSICKGKSGWSTVNLCIQQFFSLSQIGRLSSWRQCRASDFGRELESVAYCEFCNIPIYIFWIDGKGSSAIKPAVPIASSTYI